MTDINIIFSRTLLSQVIPAVRGAGYKPMKDAWVWSGGLNDQCWEFHGPGEFYWYGNADNAYEARYKGWVAFLRSKGLDADGSKLATEA